MRVYAGLLWLAARVLYALSLVLMLIPAFAVPAGEAIESHRRRVLIADERRRANAAHERRREAYRKEMQRRFTGP